MAHAVSTDVNALMNTTGVDYSVFMTTADLIVDENLTDADPPYSSGMLTQIANYLAAHFATLAKERGGLRRQTIGESSESYQTISEKFLGFLTTRFGQQAVALDNTGILAQLAASGTVLKAEFRIV